MDTHPEVCCELVLLVLKIVEIVAVIDQRLEHSLTVLLYVISMKHQLSYEETGNIGRGVKKKYQSNSYSLNTSVPLNASPARTLWTSNSILLLRGWCKCKRKVCSASSSTFLAALNLTVFIKMELYHSSWWLKKAKRTLLKKEVWMTEGYFFYMSISSVLKYWVIFVFPC